MSFYEIGFGFQSWIKMSRWQYWLYGAVIVDGWSTVLVCSGLGVVNRAITWSLVYDKNRVSDPITKWNIALFFISFRPSANHDLRLRS